MKFLLKTSYNWRAKSSDDNEKFFKRRGLQKQTMNEIDYLHNKTFKAMIGNITKHDFFNM